MRKILLTILCLIFVQTAFSQTLPRHTINFNAHWEMFRLDSGTILKHTLAIREGTSFSSQFNQESIVGKNIPADSIVAGEVRRAITGFKNEYPKISSLKWQQVSLPHPARYENELNPGVNQFTGICYYRKKFVLPAGDQHMHLYLSFEGAMQTASIWINGRFIKQHQGGYLPFNVPLNGYVKFNRQNEIIVRLDNRDNPNVPPGKPLAKLGFLYWSGIYRSVFLVATNPIYITDAIDANTIAGGGVFFRPGNISAASAGIVIKTQIRNSGRLKKSIIIKQILTDCSNSSRKVQCETNVEISGDSLAQLTQKMKVLKPSLWSPDKPDLYLLRTELWNGGREIDAISQKVGIRKLSYTRAGGFELNDKPLRIVGTNRHQDCPYVGNALTEAMQFRDLKRIKEAGFNFVRLSHYPQDPSVYRICDSIGLMLADPIPGWQFFNNNGIFKDRVFSDIREMIRRDRNHPSVIMWEVSLNEAYPPDNFRIQSAAIAHEEYPGDNFFTSGDTYAAKHTNWDVPYNGWTDPFGRPQNVQPDKPGFVREYGDYEFGGALSTTRANRSDGEKALQQNAWNLQWEHNLLRGPKYYPWTIGDANWAFFDGFEAFTKGTSDWGVMDVFRLPKFSYYFFKSQLSPDRLVFAAENKPMVYIANWWLPTDKPEKVVVYSNCDEVALYINGKFVKKQRPDAGPDTGYGDFDKGGNTFDGGNANNLQHPPFTFTGINWQTGELKAVGYIGGKKAAEYTVNTPMLKTKLQLVADDEGMPLAANGADAIFVRAEVTDKKGTVMCLDNSTKVKFTLSGEGRILGPDTVTVRGGIASVLVRSDNKTGLITIKAEAKKLKSSYLIIVSPKKHR